MEQSTDEDENLAFLLWVYLSAKGFRCQGKIEELARKAAPFLEDDVKLQLLKIFERAPQPTIRATQDQLSGTDLVCLLQKISDAVWADSLSPETQKALDAVVEKLNCNSINHALNCKTLTLDELRAMIGPPNSEKRE